MSRQSTSMNEKDNVLISISNRHINITFYRITSTSGILIASSISLWNRSDCYFLILIYHSNIFQFCFVFLIKSIIIIMEEKYLMVSIF